MSDKPEVSYSLPDGFDFIKRPGTPQFFADGVSEALIGFPVSKITFHAATGVSSDRREQRESVLQLAIPTTALMEICRNILFQGAAISPHIDAIFDETKKQYHQVVSGIEIPPPVVPKTDA